MSVKSLLVAVLALLFVVPALQPPASADRGGIPLGTVWYREDAQNAIAAWNGKEEVLVLSTDLRAETSAKLLEMLPLPSAPSRISQGSRQDFQNFIDLFNKKIYSLSGEGGYMNSGDRNAGGNSSVRILFQQSIGAHNLTVANVRDAGHFGGWVRDLAATSGVTNYTIGPEMNASVRDHLARGISCFVFDVVDVGPEARSQDPLVYRFNTTRLYYPMAITAASYGNNGGSYPRVNLFLLVDGSINYAEADFFAMVRGKGFRESIKFNQSELGTVSAEIRSLFTDGARAAHLYTTGGSFVADRWKSFEDVVILKSQVNWSGTAGQDDIWDLSVEPARARYLTCVLPVALVGVAMGVLFMRMRKWW